MSLFICSRCRNSLKTTRGFSTTALRTWTGPTEKPTRLAKQWTPRPGLKAPWVRRTKPWQPNYPLAWKKTGDPSQKAHPDASPQSKDDPRSHWEPVRISPMTFFSAARDHLHNWTNSLIGVKRLNSIGVKSEDAKRLVDTFHIWAAKELAQPRADIFSSWFSDEYSWSMNSMADFAPALDLMITRRLVSWAAQQHDLAVRGGRDPAPGLDIIAKFYQASDFRYHAEMYPDARRIHRKIIMHVGPTNSGKTYNALRALAGAKIGVYAGPLRLLAHEVYSRLNTGSILPAGVDRDPEDPDKLFPRVCNMITGEEKRIVAEDAPLASCTVEMLSFMTHYDVAVVDEIQMIGDRERGGGWTNAVLGLMADEIHLCGEPSAVPIVEALCKETGDDFVVHNYERLSPLKAASNSLEGDLSKLRDGDCVVAFSRKKIFSLKTAIEASTSHKCTVAYGMLPPELRAEQAALFNKQDNEYGIMVASDAIGMGLNLKIKRVIFESTRKFDGKNEVPLSLSSVKQIAGRAGRFTLGANVTPGIATTLYPAGLSDVQLALRLPTRPLKRAVIGPTTDHLFNLLQLLPSNAKPADVLRALPYFARLPKMFTLSDTPLQAVHAERIQDCAAGPLSAEEFWTLIHAPATSTDDIITRGVEVLLRQYQTENKTDLRSVLAEIELLEHFETTNALRLEYDTPGSTVRAEQGPPQIRAGLLRELEAMHRILIMYLWLGYRLPVAFHEHPLAFEIKEDLERCISFYLRELRPDANWKAPPPSRQARRSAKPKGPRMPEWREDSRQSRLQ